MELGYNPAAACVDLYTRAYDSRMGACNTIEDGIEAKEHDIETLHRLLSAIATKRQKSKDHINLSDEEGMQIVDAARTLCPDLILEKAYTWKAEEIDTLVETLNSRCSQITRKISVDMMFLTEKLRILSDMIKTASDTLKSQQELISSSLKKHG